MHVSFRSPVGDRVGAGVGGVREGGGGGLGRGSGEVEIYRSD